MSPAQSLRNKIASLKQELENAERALEQSVRNCCHLWSKPEPDHIYQKAYTIYGDRPGDPGYGGVDRQFDCHVPAKETKRWKRTCKHCGEVQHTSNVTQHITEEPRF
jgi:hypothetical protein